MLDHLREAVAHGFVAALTAEATLRLWAIAQPEFRLRLRSLVLGLVIVLPPVFEFFMPFRDALWFEDGLALFVAERWSSVRVFGAGLDTLGFALLATSGVALYLRDLVPFVGEHLRSLRGGARWKEAEVPPEVRADVDELCARAGIRATRVILRRTDTPLLCCRGVFRPAVVLSTGVLGRLDRRELRAALAHEIGHAASHDVLLGWLLAVARTLQAFNPVVQVLARTIARDTEARADESAARLAQDRLGVASALVKLHEATRRGSSYELASWPALAHAREAAVIERCRRMLDGPPEPEVTWGRTRLAATAVCISTLLFFVT